jgi:hypothetical protein
MRRFFTLLFLCQAFWGAAQSIVWITPCTDKTFCLNPGSCTQGAVFMTEKATTTCSSQMINYSYRVDLNNNGNIDIQSSADTATGNFPVGTHKIHWRATDGCGNINSCTYLFTIKDCNPPNLLCINGLTQNLDASNCMASFHAQQFILTLNDNCTPAAQMEYGMRVFGTGSGFPPTDSVTFDKCDLGTNFVEIWVRDASGLMNSCQNYVIVQPSQSGCVCNVSADVRLAACANTPTGSKAKPFTLRSTLVSLSGANPPINRLRTQVNVDSCFTLHHENLPFGPNYRVVLEAAMEDQDFLNGVSTFDLLQISKHILGIQNFQSFYQALAADVNKNASVTNFDILELRKLILGIYDTLPGLNDPWRLVRPVSNPANLTSFAQVKDTFQLVLNNLQVDTVFNNLKFIAIKMGDVNFNASLQDPATDDRTTATITTENTTLKAGEIHELYLDIAPDMQAEGWQMEIQAAPGRAKILGADLPAEDWSIDPSATRLRVIQANPEQLPVKKLPLRIQALEAAPLSELLALSDTGLMPELYQGNQKTRLQLKFIQNEPGESVRFYTPIPNPFFSQTTFSWWQAEAGRSCLEVFDVSGKKILHWQTELPAGQHEKTLQENDLPASGLYFYRLFAGGTMTTGKIQRH